jgi:hypothetical protein
VKWTADQLQAQYTEYGQLLSKRVEAIGGDDPNLAAELGGGN